VLQRINTKFKKILFILLHGHTFRHFGSGSFITSPFRCDGSASMSIGDSTFFQAGVWLYCCSVNDTEALLKVGKGCVFGYNNHIASVRSVVIEDYVLTANNVYISDNLHEYEDIHTPVIQQAVKFKKEVNIGAGSWIGENVCIIGASIGQNCVIGANAVVTKDIPDYSVAVGNPAKVIKRYDVSKERWVLVNKNNLDMGAGKGRE